VLPFALLAAVCLGTLVVLRRYWQRGGLAPGGPEAEGLEADGLEADGLETGGREAGGPVRLDAR